MLNELRKKSNFFGQKMVKNFFWHKSLVQATQLKSVPSVSAEILAFCKGRTQKFTLCLL